MYLHLNLFFLLLWYRLWQVFLDDKEKPGRYKLAMEQPTRPYPDDLDVIINSFIGYVYINI